MDANWMQIGLGRNLGRIAGPVIVHRQNWKPVRLILNGRRKSASGAFASLKVGVSLPWESRNELTGMEYAEVDSRVKAFHAQPMTIYWRRGEASYSYTPDRLEIRSGGVMRLVEMKSRSDAPLGTDYAQKLDDACEIMTAYGAEFDVESGEGLRASPAYSSVRRILYHSRTRLDVEDASKLDRAFAHRQSCEAHDFISLYPESEVGMAKLSSLIVRGRVSFDLNRPFDKSSILHRPSA